MCLIKHIASYGKPIILSTGMNDIESIAPAVEIMRKAGIPFALTHCTSMYPTPYEKVRLGGINRGHGPSILAQKGSGGWRIAPPPTPGRSLRPDDQPSVTFVAIVPASSPAMTSATLALTSSGTAASVSWYGARPVRPT